MGKIIVIQYVTLDGVVEDPDGRSGTDRGGWAFRFGREQLAGDKFALDRSCRRGRCCSGGAPGSTSPGCGRSGRIRSRRR